MGRPNIIVNFLTAAKTAITRSERGIVALVVADTTKTATLNTYKSITEVKAADWTAENFQIIKETFLDGVNCVHVVRAAEFTAAKTVLDGLKINWLVHIDETQTDVVSYVETRNAGGPSAKIKAVVYSATAPDDDHIVNFANTKVKRTDGTEVDGYKYLGRIAGMLAALPLNKSATYYTFTDLESVTDVEKIDEDVEAGKFVLFNDYGKVRCARAVNSATTAAKEDLKKITIIEGMDLVREDIIETFKNDYVGKYKNTLDNQTVFISAVNTYMKQLAAEGVLSPDYDNKAEIDVETQRAALISAGVKGAEGFDDTEVKNHPYSSYVYVLANVLFVDAIEDLQFDCYMN